MEQPQTHCRTSSAAVAISAACMILAVISLAAAEIGFRAGLGPDSIVALAGNADYDEQWAAADTARERELLARGVARNSRASPLWIQLGLASERVGDYAAAERAFSEAEKIDRQYLPAWSRANYAFRRQNREEFWASAQRAARQIYDDPRPLVELADQIAPNPPDALEKLGGPRSIAYAYLDRLIGLKRWSEARDVAIFMQRRKPVDGEAIDLKHYIGLVERLIDAQRFSEGLEVWNGAWNGISNGSKVFPSTGNVVNGSFSAKPLALGFDWRPAGVEGIDWKWQTGQIEVFLSGRQPDEAPLLDQITSLARPACLAFDYQTGVQGIEWRLASNSPVALHPGSAWQQARACFALPPDRGTRLRLMYRREPGTRPAKGEVALRNVRWEEL